MPAQAHASVDPGGRYLGPQVGEVVVQRAQRQLRVRLHGVEYQGFGVGRGVHYVPGVDAYLSFAATAGGATTMRWDAVSTVAPALPRQ